MSPAVVNQAIALALACREEAVLAGKILFSASSDFGCIKLAHFIEQEAAGSLLNSEVQRPEL